MIYALAPGLFLGLAALVWYFFMAAPGSECDERELELIHRKLERHAAKNQSDKRAAPADHSRESHSWIP